MTEQLKPCPFCGGAAHFFKITDLDEKNFGGEGICCGSCPITTDLMFSLMEDCKPKLAEAWNRRTQPAQAVPVLTAEAIDDLAWQYTSTDKPFQWLAFARAVEQAVRAKMGVAVPMTNTQAKAIIASTAYAFEALDIVRATERHHGIVGKKNA